MEKALIIVISIVTGFERFHRRSLTESCHYKKNIIFIRNELKSGHNSNAKMQYAIYFSQIISQCYHFASNVHITAFESVCRAME